MKRLLTLYAVAATLLSATALRQLHSQRNENRRLSANQQTLSDSVVRYRTLNGRNAASVEALTLRVGELERIASRDARTIRQLGIRLRRAESIAVTATRTDIAFEAPLLPDPDPHDRPALGEHSSPPLADTLRHFVWSDPWTTVRGTLSPHRVLCSVSSADTLRQVVHRIPRRFLFIRYGTKALRQEIVCSNPHTRIVYSRFIQVEKKK